MDSICKDLYTAVRIVAAQSTQTRATAGSDALFSDDESAESSHPEDEESDAGESDEQWAEGFTFNEE